MEYVRAEPGRFGVEEEARVRAFEAVLVRVDQTVLSGAIFQNCIEQVGGKAELRADRGGAGGLRGPCKQETCSREPEEAAVWWGAVMTWQDFEDTGGEGAEVVRVRGNETGMDAMVDALKTLLDASIKVRQPPSRC